MEKTFRKYHQGAIVNLLILVLVFFAGTTNLKISDIQISEILMLCLISISSLELIRNRFALGITQLQKKIIVLYLILGSLIFLLSVWNQTQDFIIPQEARNSLLKQPLFISIFRLVQLGFICTSQIIIIGRLTKTTININTVIRVYIYSGTLVSLYSIISYLFLTKFSINLGGAYDNGTGYIRARGLAVEGGPFGTYLISVILLSFYKIKKHKLNFILLAIQFWALYYSGSKAGFLVLMLLVFLGIIRSYFILRVVLTALATILGILFFSQFQERITSYVDIYHKLYDLSLTMSIDDPNIFMGRVVGAYIVPNMIINNPMTGIGIGNYSLLRNNGQYREGLPPTEGWDLHGLGLFGLTAELGIPLTLLLLFVLLIPIKMALVKSKKTLMLMLSSYQVIVLLFGVQITFFYPWLVAAIGMGILIHEPQEV